MSETTGLCYQCTVDVSVDHISPDSDFISCRNEERTNVVWRCEYWLGVVSICCDGDVVLCRCRDFKLYSYSRKMPSTNPPATSASGPCRRTVESASNRSRTNQKCNKSNQWSSSCCWDFDEWNGVMALFLYTRCVGGGVVEVDCRIFTLLMTSLSVDDVSKL